ncbi:MAG: DUF3592 domain-containing protein [Actinomycetota bacterium]|nr:DUF3592 domain-containing protein [Actinomycetota bacterium]
MGLLNRLDALDRRIGADPRNPQPLSRRFAFIAVAIFCAIGSIPLAATVWYGHEDENVAARLRRDGADVDAEVVGVRLGGRLRAVSGEGAKVVFRTDAGKQVTTWVTVGSAPEKGPTRVRYLRSDPSVARLVTDPVPREGITGPLVALGFLIASAAWAIRTVRKGLKWRPPGATAAT